VTDRRFRHDDAATVADRRDYDAYADYDDDDDDYGDVARTTPSRSTAWLWVASVAGIVLLIAVRAR
jgi:hypothetical protein